MISHVISIQRSRDISQRSRDIANCDSSLNYYKHHPSGSSRRHLSILVSLTLSGLRNLSSSCILSLPVNLTICLCLLLSHFQCLPTLSLSLSNLFQDCSPSRNSQILSRFTINHLSSTTPHQHIVLLLKISA